MEREKLREGEGVRASAVTLGRDPDACRAGGRTAPRNDANAALSGNFPFFDDALSTLRRIPLLLAQHCDDVPALAVVIVARPDHKQDFNVRNNINQNSRRGG